MLELKKASLRVKSRGHGVWVPARARGARLAGTTAISNRQHVVVDLGNGVDAAQPHGGEELVANDVDCLGDAGFAAAAEAVNIGAADHAGLGAERQRAHHVLTRAYAAVEHDLDPRADGVHDL